MKFAAIALIATVAAEEAAASATVTTTSSSSAATVAACKAQADCPEVAGVEMCCGTTTMGDMKTVSCIAK